MEKRGYKLQEFVAHSANVNCLKIGKKRRQHFITGGDDEKVNLWSIGNPSAITSLSGHTSPIESVAFDATEVLVAAGASSGMIKLWNLEETNVVRTLNGHRSYCTAVEFHPFGEFFASGSMDTNLKIWDIRKKGCIHTYKGHRRAVSTIRFSPDGRWVVSGGLDNVVKIWDLTAGKLLHEFKLHEGHIRSMEFHPLEFLLATGSSDRTVKFWDLETFELIGSTRPEATGVRSITFHPDGRSLFCGLDNSLKVYSWEPVICHDALDIGWSTLGDLCINDGKLLGCSYYHNSVAVWAADTSHIEPHTHSVLAEEKTRVQSKYYPQEDLTERVASPRRSTMSTDDDTKDIYVDSMTPIANLQNSKEIDDLATCKQIPAAKVVGQANGNPFVPRIVHHDNFAKDFTKSRRELSASGDDITNVSIKPSHRRRPSTTKLDIERLSTTFETGLKGGSDSAAVANFKGRHLVDDASTDFSAEKAPTTSTDSQKASSPSDGSVDSKKQLKSVKYVNGVAVVHGRTRSLVERFEKREKLNIDESQMPNLSSQKTQILTNMDMSAPIVKQTLDAAPSSIPEAKTSPDLSFDSSQKTQILTNTDMSAPIVKQALDAAPSSIPEAKTFPVVVKTPDTVASEDPEAKISQNPLMAPDVVPCPEPEAESFTIPGEGPDVGQLGSITETKLPVEVAPNVMTCPLPESKTLTVPEKRVDVIPSPENETKSSRRIQNGDSRRNIKSEEANSSPGLVLQRPRTSPNVIPEKGKALLMRRSASSRNVMPERVRSSSMLVARRSSASSRMTPERTKTSPMVAVPRHDTPSRITPEKAKSSPFLDDIPQTTGRVLTSKKDDVVEDLMLNHDMFLSNLRSRLTKLQVVRHFWEQNDARGAINALQKLSDHAVQADVVNILMEKMDSFTLDLFAFLLPVLLNLLDSNTERHISVSLELLLKLVAVFGPVVSSTISAPPTVGVDLHAEKRLECCNQCHIELQKIHKCLPALTRRGGLAARCAQELNIILQEP